MRLIITTLLFLIPFFSFGQQDFAKDMAFFQKKGISYQRWLDTLGLSPTLRVEDLRFQKDRVTGKINTKELELYLVLQASNPDSAAAQWEQLCYAFEKVYNIPLKEVLFRTFVHNMEIPDSQGNIQIYGSGSLMKKSPCFFVWVWDENATLKDSLMRNGCNAQIFNIIVPAVKIKKKGKNGKITMVAKTATAIEVFKDVLSFVQEQYPRSKYENTECSGRYPILELKKQTFDELEFTVSDLCREALTNESLSSWCKIAREIGWEKDCNDIRRECFTFDIKYTSLGEGYSLQCKLNGKFGSAAYKPRESDHFDMVPDFTSFEEDYAEIFKKALEKYLSKQ